MLRVTTLKGVEVGRYYTDRLPSYYLDGEEPPGQWWGRAAGRLGLNDQIDPEAFLAVVPDMIQLPERIWVVGTGTGR